MQEEAEAVLKKYPPRAKRRRAPQEKERKAIPNETVVVADHSVEPTKINVDDQRPDGGGAGEEAPEDREGQSQVDWIKR